MTSVVSFDRELQKNLGAVLRTMRRARKIKLVSVEAETGIPQSTYRSWEMGTRLPSLHNLSTLCRHFEIPIWKVMQMAEMRKQWEAVAKADRTHKIEEAA